MRGNRDFSPTILWSLQASPSIVLTALAIEAVNNPVCRHVIASCKEGAGHPNSYIAKIWGTRPRDISATLS